MGSILAIVDLLFRVFDILILARVVISWIQVDPYNPIVRFIFNATEPILAPIRRALPSTGMMDLSPLVAIIGAMILQAIIHQLIF
ncbi:MAG: YggT family protein [Chloroflexota bacterium]